MIEQEPLALYIHFPYCKSRCPYCDFFKALKPKNFDEDEMIKVYQKDIAFFRDMLGIRKIKSIFFGGGTPSILSADGVESVLNEISKKFVVSDEAEISLEANPNTFDKDKFVAFNKAGINRLSLGVQALNEADLKFLGRTHTIDEAKKAIELGVKTFEKFSIDLIYARPNQTWEDWQKEIDMALSYGLKHISLYQLTIEEGTVFYRKKIKGLEEEKAAELYQKTVQYLRNCGLERYEVSNFARSVKDESVHNLVYWQGGDYIGIGQGAHGRLRHQGKIYATIDGQIESELTPYERAEELLIMGLRISTGINFKRFYEISKVNFFEFVNNLAIKKLAQLKLLCYDSDNIWLTDRGFLFLDEIIRQLVD